MAGIVRRATIDDAETIGRVHYAAHIETYIHHIALEIIEGNPPERRTRMWQRVIGEQLGDVWVAEQDSQIVGFASTGPPRDDNPPRNVELAAIYLLAAHKRHGLGQLLLDATLGDRPASLWVIDENPKAIAFYRRNDFETDGAEKIDADYGNIREIRLVR